MSLAFLEFFKDMDFITRACLVGTAIALVSGPLGSLIIWRRMSNLGDTLAHSSLMGITLALSLSLPILLGIVGVGLTIGLLLWISLKNKRFTSDAALVVIAQTALAIGLIIGSQLKGIRFDLFSYLFGDILTATPSDLLWVMGTDIAVIVILFLIWRPLLSSTIHEELSRVEKDPVDLVQFLFLVLIIFVFGVAIQLVGVLLITALLIIPAFAAANLSKTPEQMVVISSILGIIGVLGGILLSVKLDWPTGPSIVVTLFGVLVVSTIFSLIYSKLSRNLPVNK